MSITVSAIPFNLISGIISMIGEVSLDAKVQQKDFNKLNNDIKNLMQENSEVSMEKINELICREYETVFADKDLLIKTLTEHGVENIQVNGENVFGKMENFRLDFYREGKTAYDSAEPNPYKMKITATCLEDEVLAFVDDINTEYTANTQEESYIKIKERLSDHGLEINEEEVYEDNTIVLTVNID